MNDCGVYKSMYGSVIINNVPKCYEKVKYLVARFDPKTREWWFYGGWDNYNYALNASMEIDCVVFINNNCLD